MQMQIYKPLKKQQSLGVAVLRKTGASSVTGGIPGEHVQNHADGEVQVVPHSMLYRPPGGCRPRLQITPPSSDPKPDPPSRVHHP